MSIQNVAHAQLDKIFQSLGVEDAASARKLSRDYALQKWVDHVKPLFTSQIYFAPFIRGLGPSSSVLVIDDSKGILASQLADIVRTVHIVVEDQAASRAMQSMMDASGHKNIRFIESKNLKQVLEEGLTLDATVIVRMSARTDSDDLIDSVELLTRCSEHIWIMDLNAFALRRIIGNFSSILRHKRVCSPFWWKNKVARSHKLAKLYWDNHGSNLKQSPRVVLSSNDWKQSSIGNGDLKSALKKVLVQTGILKWLSPGFVVCSDRKVGVSWFERAVDLAVSQAAEPLEVSNFQIKQVLAGNRSVILVFWGDDSKEFVWRIASTPEGKQRVQTNANALITLQKDSKVSRVTPRLSYQGCLDGYYFSLEEKLGGNEPVGEESFQISDHDVKSITWLRDWQLSQKEVCVFSRSVFDETIGQFIGEIKSYCIGDEAKAINDLESHLQSVLIDKQVTLVPLHGDLKPGNVLFGSDEEIQAVIDWDMFEIKQLPLVDLYIHLIYKHCTKNSSMVDSFKEQFWPRYLNGEFDFLLDLWRKEMKIEVDQEYAALVLAWVLIISRQFEKFVKLHDDTMSTIANDLIPFLLSMANAKSGA